MKPYNTFAGDIIVKEVTIINNKGEILNILNQLVAINIFQNIFEPFMTGNIVVRESIELSELLPFVGYERVYINMYNPYFKDYVFSNTFLINSLVDKQKTADREYTYVFNICSIHVMVDINNKFSRVLKGNVSDIVTKLLVDETIGLSINSSNVLLNKRINIEPTINSIKYTSNYWTPVKNINFLCNIAKSDDSIPDYLFFEDSFGFYFSRLQTLYKSQVKYEFIIDNYINNIRDDGVINRNILEDYKRVYNIHINRQYDYIQLANSGALSSTSYSYDLYNKKIILSKYNLRNLNTYKMNKYDLINKTTPYNEDNNINYLIINSNLYNNNLSPTIHENIQARYSIIKLLTNNSLTLTVPGAIVYNVGDTVQIKSYKNIEMFKTSSDIYDNNISGIYIITALKHTITVGDRHESVLELSKDSININ